MRWLLLSAVVFGLSITDVASQAEGPPDAERLSLSQATPEDAGFFATTGVVRFQMVQGRLCLDPPRHRKGSQSRDQSGIYESITVTADRGIPSLHYVCQSSAHHLTLSVEQATHVRVESFCPDSGQRSILQQPQQGPIRWTIKAVASADDQTPTVHQGATLLHLRQCDPEQFDFHHGRLIERLLRGQSIAEISAATAAAMIRHAEHGLGPDASQVRAAIEELRAPRRAQRLAAQQQLLRWGTPIIPVVESIDANTLDAEQRDRLRSVHQRLRKQIDDTPASLAMRLIIDQHYWSLLATRLSASQVIIANAHLRRCGLQPLAGDRIDAARIARAAD